MEKIRLGFIGTGPRGQGVIRHSLKEKRIELAAICDKFECQLQKGVEASGKTDIKACLDHRQVLDDRSIDAVYICVEPENNANLIIESLNAGKHVMCDVPLCFSLEDCWNIVVNVEKNGKIFQLGEQMRYAPFVRAWKEMVDNGNLGKILFVEGHYLHTRTPDRFFQNPATGERVSFQEALESPDKFIKSRAWKMLHPILYLPHELSPLLYILDDRVRKVSCMSSGSRSHVYDWFDRPDFECAIMHTGKNTVMRMAAGFTAPTPRPNHWYHVWGTKGKVETNRTENEKMKMWLAGKYMNSPAELTWEYDQFSAPLEALQSGHGGMDYYPFQTFADAIITGSEPHLGIYHAVETAAPAIISSISVDQDGKCLDVPDFRPSTKRAKGKLPLDFRG